MKSLQWIMMIGLAATTLGTAVAADAKTAPVALTEAGQKLEAHYAAELKKLQTDLTKIAPVIEPQHKEAWMMARAAVSKAVGELKTIEQSLEKIYTAKALVEHAKGKWLGGAERGIAQAQQMLKKATNDAERQAAQKELEKWQADQVAGQKALQERTASYEKLKGDEPQLNRAKTQAQTALTAARVAEQNAASDLWKRVAPVVESDKYDELLVKGAVLANATPRGLAEFAQQSEAQRTLVEKFLGSQSLMKQMLEAGGAKGGQYGRAVQIYADIRKASPNSRDGIFQRLALGTSLEHAIPIAQQNSATASMAPSVVDPVKRYLHYEQAYLQGELDPAFPNMTAWHCRMIVNSTAPDHVLSWGREMLRNYRPDHISNPDYGWRYSGLVRTDVAYRSLSLLEDDPALEFFQNVCKEGGVCGRRAFFGRFIIKSFGLPTWGVAQHKHAAVGRWTPAGWVVNLGANWNFSWSDNPLDKRRTGTDFLLEAQAREHSAAYGKVLRAQWVADLLDEPKYDSTKEGSGGIWNQLALYQKQEIVSAAKPKTLAALGQDLGEANESVESKAKALEKVSITAADKQIAVSDTGVITIPAAACSGAQLMKSYLGGQQMVCGGTVTCPIEISQAGKYALTARVVTLHEKLQLQVTATQGQAPVLMNIPYTCGRWEKTAPIELMLSSGKNVLTFSKPTKSFTIKEFVLTPVR